jgi:FkbM family methyltransferase
MGEKAALFSELGARVICVEPQPSCLENLSRRFGKNPRITIVAAGAGAHLGNAQIAVCDDDPGVSTMSEKWRFQGRFASKRSWSHTVNVPLTTLDALIAQYGTPAFCKIDVEGFEVEVLKGLSQPIRCISFEFSSEFLEDTAICIKHLQRIGNPQFRFSPGDSMRFDTSSWLNGDDMMMHLSSLEGEYPWGDIYAKFDV